MSDTERLTKAFSEALDACTNPADDWVSVGRGFLAEAIDHMDWLEKGNAEWRDSAHLYRAAHAARATRRWWLGWQLVTRSMYCCWAWISVISCSGWWLTM